MTPQELKNSIVHLAIQGKLVEQNESDRPISISSSYSGDISELYEVPERWKWVALKDVVTINTGLSFKKQDQLDSTKGTLRVLRGGNIGDDYKYHLYDDDTYVDIKQFQEKYISLCEGDVISPSVTSIEKICKAGFIDKELENITAGGFVYIIRCKELSVLEPKYLLYFVTSSFNKEQCKPNIHKSGQAFYNLKKTGLIEQPICLPPLAEQKRIIAKIEELLPYIDRYEKAWSKLEEFNKRFPNDMQKSVLQMAIEGKLVEQRPEDGTAEELYRQIQEEKQRLINEGKIKKEKPLPEITEDEVPFDIPESWKWVRIEKLLLCQPSNGISPKGVDYQTNIKNLTLTATTSGYFKPNAFKYVDIKNEVANKYYLKNEDILIQRSNSRELVGTSCIYRFGNDNFIYPDLMMRIHLLDGVDVDYIDYVLKSPNCRLYFQKSASGTSKSMPKINQTIVRKTLIPLPPLAEQKRIVQKLEEILPLCEKLK